MRVCDVEGGLQHCLKIMTRFKNAGPLFRALVLCVLPCAGLAAVPPWEKHGLLRVSESGRIIEHEDGTPFLWLGNTAWHLYTLRADDIDEYFSDRASKGFNVVHIMAAKGARNRHQFGFATAPRLNSVYFHMNGRGYLPFDSVSPVALNEDYWKTIDAIVETGARYGVYVCLTAMWGSGAREWFPEPSRGNYEYARLVAERYRAAPNVLWTAVGEFVKISGRGIKGPITQEEEELLNRVGEGLEAGAADHQLIGMHGNQFHDAMPSTYFHNAPWLDFHMNQSWDRFGYIADMTENDRGLNPPKPTFLSEGKYEGSVLTSGAYEGLLANAWPMRFQAYWSILLGGLGHSYGAFNIWNADGKLDRHALALMGSSQVPRVRKMFADRSLADLEPDPALIVSSRGDDETLDLVAAARSKHGEWALIYDTQGKGMTLDLRRLQGESFEARWFDPRLGVYRPFGMVTAKSPVEFDPPGNAGPGKDWVLVLDAVAEP